MPATSGLLEATACVALLHVVNKDVATASSRPHAVNSRRSHGPYPSAHKSVLLRMCPQAVGFFGNFDIGGCTKGDPGALGAGRDHVGELTALTRSDGAGRKTVMERRGTAGWCGRGSRVAHAGTVAYPTPNVIHGNSFVTKSEQLGIRICRGGVPPTTSRRHEGRETAIEGVSHQS